MIRLHLKKQICMVGGYMLDKLIENKESSSMNELNCKKCDKVVECDEEATAITCSMCVMIDVDYAQDGSHLNASVAAGFEGVE